MEIKNKVISFLGDSITEGVGASSNEKGYPNLIGEKYGAKKVNNYGVAGTCIARQQDTSSPLYNKDFCVRSLNIDKESDIIVVFGGTNDLGLGDAPFGQFSDRTPDTFYGALHTLILNLINEYPTAAKIICTPLHRGTEVMPRPHGKVLLDYVNAIKEVAEYYSIPVCDLWRNSGLQPRVPIIQQLYCPDTIHPNDEGYKILAERIADFILKL